MNIDVSLGDRSYDIVFEHGAIGNAGFMLHLNRKVLIVTDSGVPEHYAQTVKKQCWKGFLVTLPQGEQSKSLSVYQMLLETMLSLGFTRKDCIVAVGGGMVCDVAGFAAASYMRGVDFYVIPTTLLAQVDASVGGKTGIDLNGVKNLIGAFYQPKRVLIDPDVLSTLPDRMISNGLAESLKMALTSDEKLFSIFSDPNALMRLDEIILRSVSVKKRIVEVDEKETGLRRVLNFGHTIGHALESVQPENGLLHGECVALGMLPMCGDVLRQHVIRIYRNLHLPLAARFNADEVIRAVEFDKVNAVGGITAVRVDAPGKYFFQTITPDAFAQMLRVIQLK